MDDLTKKLALFGYDSKNINIQFSNGEWCATYNDGVFNDNAGGDNAVSCVSKLYELYCKHYSPETIAENLFNLIEKIETDKDFELCSLRHNYLKKIDDRFVWKSVKPQNTITAIPEETRAVISTNDYTTPEPPKKTPVVLPEPKNDVHANDGYPDYFMKKNTDLMYTDAFGIDYDGNRVLVKINRFDYEQTAIYSNPIIGFKDDEIMALGKDEYDSYYMEAKTIIDNRKYYAPIDYSNVTIIKD